jgi:hypothetical protein
MPSLKQDSKGQYFVDTGGGVLHPVSEEQAQIIFDNPGAGAGAGAALNQGIENLITGAAANFGAPGAMDANQQGRELSDALNLQTGLLGQSAQFAPQVGAGIATAGAGLPAIMGVEGALGAMTTPESPLMGAAIGAGTAGVAELIPGAGAALYGRGRDLARRIPGFGRASPYEEIPINPGGMAPGERAPVGAQAAQGPGGGDIPPGPGAATPFPENPPDPMELLRARAAELDAQEAAAAGRGRTAAAGPGGRGGGAGGFYEGEPFVGPPSPSANPPGSPPSPQPRMAERVTETINQASGGEVGPLRVMEGTMTPDELYVRGVPSTAGDRAILTARAGDEAGGAAARDLMQNESKLTSHPIFGAGIRNIRDAQKQAATNFLGREMDVPFGVNLTDPMVSDIKQNIGGRLDQIASDMGNVPIDQTIKDQFAQVLEQTTGAHKGALKRLADEIEAMAQLNNGALDGNQWQIMRTKFNDMIESGIGQTKPDKVFDAERMMKVMVDAMEGNLPDATKKELRKLRKQYAIASTLQKPGARNADGQLNPTSFYSNWKRGQWGTRHGQDDIGRFMNTIVTLTTPRTPDSGSAGRYFAGKAAEAAGNLIPGVGTARSLLGL